MNNTKYTFLLPAYKARFFEEALLSIKNQTYTDFKVIVSDDCSPEELKPIYDKVCGDDPRFTFRRNEENMGSKSLVSHWNLLVDMCDTEWLIMAGDDDVYDPTFLEEMDKLQVKYPNVDLLHARARVIDAEGDVVKLDCAYDEYVSQLEFLAFIGMNNHIECVGNYIYRKDEMIKKKCFLDFPLAWNSDIATSCVMSFHGCVSSNLILFNFRMSGSNISSINDVLVSKNKIEASLKYGKFLDDLFVNFFIDSKLTRLQLDMAKKSQMLVVLNPLWQLSCKLNLRDFIRLNIIMRKRRYLCGVYQIYQYWKKWFKFRLLNIQNSYYT